MAYQRSLRHRRSVLIRENRGSCLVSIELQRPPHSPATTTALSLAVRRSRSDADCAAFTDKRRTGWGAAAFGELSRFESPRRLIAEQTSRAANRVERRGSFDLNCRSWGERAAGRLPLATFAA
jgi:hypothetical protein